MYTGSTIYIYSENFIASIQRNFQPSGNVSEAVFVAEKHFAKVLKWAMDGGVWQNENKRSILSLDRRKFRFVKCSSG